MVGVPGGAKGIEVAAGGGPAKVPQQTLRPVGQAKLLLPVCVPLKAELVASYLADECTKCWQVDCSAHMGSQ